MNVTADQMQNFERAFSCGTAGCRRECSCGRIFFNDDPSYSWEPGELDSLRNDAKATAVDYAPGDIWFEGKDYVDGCTCWHPRAKKIIEWILAHDSPIAQFLSLERRRKVAEAERSPVVL